MFLVLISSTCNKKINENQNPTIIIKHSLVISVPYKDCLSEIEDYNRTEHPIPELFSCAVPVGNSYSSFSLSSTGCDILGADSNAFLKHLLIEFH